MIPRVDNKAFASIMEIVVTALFFSITSLAIFSTVSMLGTFAPQSGDRLNAALTAKGFLDELRGLNTPTVWNTGKLTVGNHSEMNGSYSISYTVSAVAGVPDVRRVDLTITYPD